MCLWQPVLYRRIMTWEPPSYPEQNQMHLCVGTQELQERYHLSSAPKIGKVHLCVGTQELQERYR